MEFWYSVLGAAVGSGGLMAIGGFIVRGWVNHKLDARLASFQQRLDASSSISNSLYSNRERAIIEFNQATREFLGVTALIVNAELTPTEIRQYWQEWLDFYAKVQSSRFLGKLVYSDPLIEASESVFNILYELRFKAVYVLSYKAQEQGVKFVDDEDPSKHVAKVSENRFNNCLDQSKSLLATVNKDDGALKRWEIAARDALREIEIL